MLGLATRAQCLLGIPAFVFLVITCSPHADAQEVDAPLDLELPAEGSSVDLDESNSADLIRVPLAGESAGNWTAVTLIARP
jgi:hypothetical protein